MKLTQAIDRLRPSVVQVAVGRTGAPVTVLGTGFAVGPARAIVTALHVVSGAEEHIRQVGGELNVGFAGPDVDEPGISIRANFVHGPASVMDRDEANDLALLDASVPPMSVVVEEREYKTELVGAQLGDRPVRDGESVACSGYPLGEPSLVTTSGAVASRWALDDVPGHGFQERFLGDFTANPGNSGGPVYRLEDGRVVGVLVAGKLRRVVGAPGHHAAGLSVVVPAAAVAELLKRNGVDWRPSLREQPVQRQQRRRKRR